MKKIFIVLSLLLLVGCAKRSNDSTPPEITLQSNVDMIEVGSSWNDAGCIALDEKDGTVTCTVQSNNVNTEEIGEYEVIYKATDSSGNISRITRKVTVVDEATPTLTLNAGIDTIKVGESWIDAGVTVTDNYDTDLSYTVSESINSNIVGEYIITYTTIDSSGNTNSITRYVNVVE